MQSYGVCKSNQLLISYLIQTLNRSLRNRHIGYFRENRLVVVDVGHLDVKFPRVLYQFPAPVKHLSGQVVQGLLLPVQRLSGKKVSVVIHPEDRVRSVTVDFKLVCLHFQA